MSASATELLRRNALYWAHHIRCCFIPQIDAFTRCLVDRLLPTFDDLEREADRVEREADHRPCSPDADPAAIAEGALDEALVFIDTMRGIERGLINMFATGLSHAIEQQLLRLHRRQLLDHTEQTDAKLWTFDEAKRRLASAGIEVDTLPAWPRINELRALANAVKHGDGPSCVKLKALRPELFIHPMRRNDRSRHGLGLRHAYLDAPVFQPLMGESIYVTRADFEQYTVAARSFLAELADALEHMGR